MQKKIKQISFYSFILGLTFIFFTSCSNSNDFEIFGKIYGNISDYSTGQSLDNAIVTISPSGHSVNTDANGYYQFENLDPLTYTITVQKTGYQPNRKSITAISGENIKVDIQLTQIPK